MYKQYENPKGPAYIQDEEYRDEHGCWHSLYTLLGWLFMVVVLCTLLEIAHNLIKEWLG